MARAPRSTGTNRSARRTTADPSPTRRAAGSPSAATSAEARLIELKLEVDALRSRLEQVAPDAPAAAAPMAMIAPPRVVLPRFVDAEPPQVIDMPTGGRAMLARQGLSLGLPGLVELNIDDSGAVSVGTPVGGVTVDGEGVKVDAGGVGSAAVGKDGISVTGGGAEVKVGKDGASVTLPGGGGVSIGRDGRVSVTAPGQSGGGGGIPLPVPFPAPTPLPIPIPVPRVEIAPVSIPIPMPRIVVERFDLPIPIPHAPPLPDLAALTASIKDLVERFAERKLSDARERIESLLAPLERDPIVDMVEDALRTWKLSARLRDIDVVAATAIGRPGCLSGPPFEPLVAEQIDAGGAVGAEGRFQRAVAAAIGGAFDRWAAGVTVPGLPWYPHFAAFPGPMAPPAPNVPTPLAACVSAAVDELVDPRRLQRGISDRLAPSDADDATKARARRVALQLAARFAAWLARQMVMSVIGQGPVPSFAPPAVPAGPVVGGSAEGLPGCLAA